MRKHCWGKKKRVRRFKGAKSRATSKKSGFEGNHKGVLLKGENGSHLKSRMAGKAAGKGGWTAAVLGKGAAAGAAALSH